MDFIKTVISQYSNPTMMLYAIIFFAIGLVLLIKGGDWFVDGAVGIAKRFRHPELDHLGGGTGQQHILQMAQNNV